MPIEYLRYWETAFWNANQYFSLEISNITTNKTQTFYLSRSYKEQLIDAFNFLVVCASWTIEGDHGDNYYLFRNPISKSVLQSLKYIFEENLGDFLHDIYALWKESGRQRIIKGSHIAESICKFPEVKEETIRLMLLDENELISAKAKNHPAAKNLVAFY